jgi:hypothetical protein
LAREYSSLLLTGKNGLYVDLPLRVAPLLCVSIVHTWIIAAALQATASAKNAASVVLMIRVGNFETILTGDATRRRGEHKGAVRGARR